MAALFRPRANVVFATVLAAVAALVAGAPTAAWIWMRTPYATGQHAPPPQPVPFDHRHHVRDDAIDCRYCHFAAERSPTAGIPPTAVCMNCHSQIFRSSPLLAPVRESWFENRPLSWERVNGLPDHVYFDHSAHVRRGVGCVECHGRVDLMPLASQSAPLQMGWCLDCHRDPAPRLRPPDKATDMEWKPPGDARRFGESLAGSMHVKPPMHCSGCHR